MCEKNFAFWCCTLLLLVSSSSKSQKNSTNNEEKDDNLTVRYELDMNSTTNYGDEIKTLYLYEKFINNTQYDEMQYESHTTSMSNNREDDDSIQYKLDKHSIQNHEDDEHIPMKSHTKLTNVSHKLKEAYLGIHRNWIKKNDSMAHKFFINSSEVSNKIKIVSYKECVNTACKNVCCSFDDRRDDDECSSEKFKYFSPNFRDYSIQSENETEYKLIMDDLCQGNDRFLIPKGYQYDYMIFNNGSLYLSYYEIFIKTKLSCLAVVKGDKFEVSNCSETFDEIWEILKTINDNKWKYVKEIRYVNLIVSIPLLVSIFLVYSILPELRNVHGFMLRNYSGALFVAYIFEVVSIIIKAHDVQDSVCITIAFFNYFLLLTSSFWLFVISFDMWWAFTSFYSLQRNGRQRGKKMLVYYAIYAWGCPFIFAINSVIMHYFSEDLPYILRPEFRAGDCWFLEKDTFALFYYGLKSVCIISSICLSISTALKIARYEKGTGLRLTDSESQRYNDNKKWFNLYLKLFILQFILMGIKLFMTTIQPLYFFIPYVIDLMDIMQNLCTFIIFVWKKKIKLMLQKRFSCGLFPEARCGTNATSSSTWTTTSEEMSI